MSNGTGIAGQRPGPSILSALSGHNRRGPSLLSDILALIVLLISGGIIGSLGYQGVATWSLPIGGDSVTHRRLDDKPFLIGFNAPEPDGTSEQAWWEIPSPGYPYRWARSQATITIPGIGGHDWIMTLSATSGRPGGEPVESRWQLPNQQSLTVLLPANPRQYHLLARTTAKGDMVAHLHTTQYVAPDDPRDLGFVLRKVQIAPVQAPFQLPALGQLGWLSIIILLTYPLIRWLLWSPQTTVGILRAAGVVLIGIGIIGVLLITHRIGLTVFTPRLVLVMVLCWVLAIPFHLLLRAGLRIVLPDDLAHSGRKYIGIVLLLVLMAFSLRIGGMLHPHAVFSDHYLNANNLLEVGLGNIFFTEGLPLRAGGGSAPYPPGSYLIAAPLLLIAPGDLESRVMLVQGCVAMLDSLGVAFVWILLMRAGVGRRAALIGAMLMLAPAPMLASFSIGEYANIGGQALALPVLALLTLSVRSLATGPMLALLVLWLGVGWLGHLGVTISLTLLLGGWGVVEGVRILFRSRFRNDHALWAAYYRVIAGIILAATTVLLCYYSAPIFIETIATRFQHPEEPIALSPSPSPGDVLIGLINQLFNPGSRIGPVLVVSGIFGILWLLLRQTYVSRSAGLVRILLAWWFGVGCSFAILLFAMQGVRWEHFLFPALCLGSAHLLAAWGRRGRAGSVVAWGCLLMVLSHGIIAWINRIYSYLH